MGVPKTIAIIVLIYYGMKLFMRHVAPFILAFFVKKTVEKAGKHFQKQAEEMQRQQQAQQQEQQKEVQKKNILDDAGDYIDYEEV